MKKASRWRQKGNIMENIQSEENELLCGLKDLLILSGLPPVNVGERNYWFLRTLGGEYFDEFFMNDYVAVGWDDVPCIEEKDRTDQLKENLKEHYGQPTRVLNQVLRFCSEMKKGDIVIIPSSGSASLAFGRIIEDDYYEYTITEEEREENKCPYKRRRKVKWLKSGKRNMIDPKLFSFFRNQQALANANDYKEFIERAINPFYVKDGVAHLNLGVHLIKSPKATDIPYYILGLNEKVAILSKELNLNYEEPESRINVQSEGIIEFFGSATTIFALAFVLVAIFGGEFKFLGIQLKTEGVIKTIIDAYAKIKTVNTLVSDEKMKEIQERLEIEDPRGEKEE